MAKGYINEIETKKRAVIIGALQTMVATLLDIFQMYGILAIKIFQQQMKLCYFITNLSSPNTVP